MPDWDEVLHGWDGHPHVPAGKRPVQFRVREYWEEMQGDVYPDFDLDPGHIAHIDENWWVGWAYVDDENLQIKLRAKWLTGNYVRIRMTEFSDKGRDIEANEVKFIRGRKTTFELEFTASNHSELNAPE